MLHVRYSYGGQDLAFDVSEADDTKVICEQIEAHLRSAHPQLVAASITSHVVDGVLNALADNNDEVVLTLPATPAPSSAGNGADDG